jgi:hypothetical protein
MGLSSGFYSEGSSLRVKLFDLTVGLLLRSLSSCYFYFCRFTSFILFAHYMNSWSSSSEPSLLS